MLSIPSAIQDMIAGLRFTLGSEARRHVRAFIFLFVGALFALFPSGAHCARVVTLAWEQGPGAVPAGYAVFVRQQGQSYDFTDPAWEGTETTCTISDLEDNTVYLFVARAVDQYGNQSESSNEVYLGYAPQIEEPPDSGGDDGTTPDPVDTGEDPPDAGGTGGGGGITPLPPPPDEGDVVDPETPVESGLTVEAGVTLDNAGKTLSGDITLGQGARIDGGTVTGTLTGLGEGATITNAVIDVTSVSGVTFGYGCKVTQTTVDANPGMDLTGMISEPGQVVEPDVVFLLDAMGRGRTVIEVIEELLQTVLGDETAAAQADAEGTITLSAQALGDVVAPGKVESVTTGSQPDGVEMSRTGELVLTRDRVVITMAPAWFDTASLKRTLKDAGLDCHVSRQGVMLIEGAGREKVALRPDSTAIRYRGSGNKFESVSAPVRLRSDPKNPESPYFVLTYPDGTAQRGMPFVYDLGAFKEFMETNGVNYFVSSSTGVITVLGQNNVTLWKGMPSYTLLSPPTGASGITFELAGDLNRDGRRDIYMITDKGKQAIYTLP
jgi:hypothetical protein